MSTSLAPIHVFIDLEGFVDIATKQRSVPHIEQLLTNIPRVLTTQGFRVDRLWGVLRMRQPQRQPPEVTDVFEKHRAELVWTSQIADLTLISEMYRRYDAGTLSRIVLLATNDKDFLPLVRDLKKNGHFVIISGHNVARSLCLESHQFTSIGAFVAPQRVKATLP